ncbi:hypothetical protein W97_03237 [Coniosporium apollinis CBS 100218]|uniref:FMP27 GFWDK domain-containing protein n=1 Tax=Coniosporium apollinis (strain CBS 100218) TaxID=1168221 RepID=R7YQ36_CONA1|nr:uncharacterized protein W97_03237 [Coniosporium apollinis CBS 100218]EON64007.1 hypothetical protein W97_03237 [Coniosporium apollinis CBS 100218]
MALPSLSFIAGVAVLLYLSTFVIFALFRIITGISIQRIGWSGLRRIHFSPTEGLRVDIRGLGFTLHRPTFAQPTWISIELTQLELSVDLKLLGGKNEQNSGADSETPSPNGKPSHGAVKRKLQRSRTWERLTLAKEKIKRLHRKINWVRVADLVVKNLSINIIDVGTIQVASLSVAVDVRRKTVDRTRLFLHRKASSKDQRPAEWIFTARSILFIPEGKDSTEILDHCTLNVHGLLYKDLEGLRDASIALKLGRLSVPYDDLETSLRRIKNCRRAYSKADVEKGDIEISLADVMEELDRPGSREESIIQTVSDSKEFLSSILRGIQEIQFAVGFFGLSKRVRLAQPSVNPIYLNVSMKEVGLDLLRLDPKSPAHLMYFSPTDVAHQALIAAISVSVGINDGEDRPERLLYVPMATTTVKTTLPSKTIQLEEDKSSAERNTNMLFANLVVTSPSLDLDPKHLPMLLALLQSRQSNEARMDAPHTRRHIMSRLLPKASIKTTIHEPVIRVALPPMESDKIGTGEFDLLISATSSISFDTESSHSADGELHYAVASNLRISSHQFYYQTASGNKSNLLAMDSLEFKIQLSASPEVMVFATANFQTLSVYMIRPEISEGVRQIFVELNSEHPTVKSKAVEHQRPKFLRQLPQWLVHVQFQGSDFNFEVASVDAEVSKHPRGAALHVESWTAQYKAHKSDETRTRPVRRRAMSQSISRNEAFIRPVSPSPSRKPQADATDGRRLAIHVSGLEGFVIESADALEPEPFLSLPKFEVAFTTSTDQYGPIFHINSYAKSLYMQYSLYRHFAIGVAITVLRKTFLPQRKPRAPHYKVGMNQNQLPVDGPKKPVRPGALPEHPEISTFDFKAGFIQVKASMPSNPQLMVQAHGLEAGSHRWATPFARLHQARLYAEHPMVKQAWSRIVSVKALRLDMRRSRRRYGTSFNEEESIDVVADAIRIAVPHQLVVHKIFDNITNTVKTVQQLHHRFRTDSDEYILQKRPVGPKRVPRISFRTHAVLFEIEDGSFEWKLGVIYRVGLLEQKQRLAREEAFRLKVKKLQELDNRQEGSSFRSKSARLGRERHGSRKSDANERRSYSVDRLRGRSSRSRNRRASVKMRYDIDGTCDISDNAKTTTEQAWKKLQSLNAQSWKKRIDHGLSFQSRAMHDIRSIFWGVDELPDDYEQSETILTTPRRPALMAVLISDFNLLIDKPSFALHDYPLFLESVGKGMPVDMQYSLLIPMHVQVNIGEARITLRDYPLPFLHVPSVRPGQSPRLSGLSMRTDFVIAEEYRDDESARFVRVDVVPPEKLDSGEIFGGFSVNVRRTVSPVKTYSNMTIDINTASATQITWGTSYQPAIQEAMQVIEGFTKPAVDPSERVGFWDKIRLNFHSRIKVDWTGDGDVHLILKGCSRDPYKVTGNGAGFVMVWRNNVQWQIAQDPSPRKFMTVNSGTYVLAVPDLSHYARQPRVADMSDSETASTASSYQQTAMFKKTIMKLSGDVQWLVGLVFERNVDKTTRSFDFVPHYEVVFRRPGSATDYDAFRGFRSHHIHLSLAIAAPVGRDWSASNLQSAANYNSIHLTPRFFSHFYSWWSQFSGVMSLPIRQGKLWPGIEKSSKKFGRHLATIEYSLLLSPLYMSHVYKHKDVEEYGKGVVSATGLKLRLDSFMLDLHQRREEFRTPVKGSTRQTKTSGMRINEAQLDFISADIRAVSATIAGTEMSDIDAATDDTFAAYQQGLPAADLSRFSIPDNDLSWVDMDDFVELDWMLPAESNPETRILPLAFAPRFTYFRQTDHEDTISGDPRRSSAFGKEPSHDCKMSANNDPRRVQRDLIEQRLRQLAEQLEHNQRSIGEQELKVVRDADGDARLREELDALRKQMETLQRTQSFLQSMFKTLTKKLETGDRGPVPDRELDNDFYAARRENRPTDTGVEGMDSSPLEDYISDFNNRFIVHNAQLKWSNSLRNIILRYIHQVSQRRGFVYYMSRRAVKFILDIVEEQRKSRVGVRPEDEEIGAKPVHTDSMERDDEPSVQDRVQQLLDDGKKFVTADDPVRRESEMQSADKAGEDVSKEFTPQNTYYVRLVAPQIQLQSEKNTKAVVLVTARGIQLKVIQIMDKDRVTDEVSGLVQRRFSAAMESLQMYVASQTTFSSAYRNLHPGNHYGTPAGSVWPPWVPFEVMFDFDLNPYGFQMVVERTSATLRYDKYNTLRLKYNDDVTGDSGHRHSPDSVESRLDHLWINFPQVRAICDSSQYYAMYIIVLDLLLYSEPLEKTRTERLEKIMLASDFSDLTGAPEMVVMLQERIRQLEEIKGHFQINEQYLDRQGWKDRISIEQDLAHCEDELFFMMKAITTSQRKSDDRTQTTQSTGLLRWYIAASEIVWHLVREGNQSLAEFQLVNALYDRTDNNDGSNWNCMEVEHFRGFNLLPSAQYPEMIAAYYASDRSFTDGKVLTMLRIQWYMLEAIAGIPVMDHFEVNLFPLKVQLEREIGKRLFEYIFPGMGSNSGENGGFSPLMVKHMLPSHEEEHDSDMDESTDGRPTLRTRNLVHEPTQGKNLTVPNDLAQRLKPTLTLPDKRRPKRTRLEGRADSSHHLRPWKDYHRNKSSTDVVGPLRSARKDASTDILISSSKMPKSRSATNLSAMNGSETDKSKRFALHRNNSNSVMSGGKDTGSDDLTQMMNRASNYMTLAYVKIPSVVLCLSYKGKGQRNFEDVHDLVFRMPTLEYRNKTWSNLDLALQLKKDIIRALISHVGAIVGNKFSHHRPSKQQQSRLRQLASSAVVLKASRDPSTAASEASSIMDRSPGENSSDSEARPSFASERDSILSRTNSFSSSTHSGAGTPLMTGTASTASRGGYAASEGTSSAANSSPRAEGEVGVPKFLVRHDAY